MTYILFAWLTVVFYGNSSLVGKLATKYHITNPWLYNFVWNFITLIITIPVSIYAGVGSPHHWDSILLLSLFNVLASIFYVLALYSLDLSVLSPLYIFRAPLSAILGLFIFGEKLTVVQIGLIGMITIAGIFVSMDEKFSLRSFFRKPIVLVLCAVCISAIYGATVKNAMSHDGFWEVTLWSTIFTQVILFLTAPNFWHDIVKTRLIKYQGIAISTVFSTVGLLFSYKAYAANIGVTSAIMALPFSMILAFILAIIAPKILEKHSLKVYAVRFTAAAVMFLAALGLSH